ncbi:fibronectin type III domain-containing protein 5 isoform X1 [Maniola jurtina]|uniref:fibronectin type III domain-containing protein 5 isoform X1 n=1 Tax=Maniola jurtina TaxID=191418 RepID=UPI001E686125|nr:fibronectin type III domain-containing protein 5 isoform X1 [Maniola jurtina]
MRRAPLAQPAAVALALSVLLRFVDAGSMGPGVPENITVTFLNPTTVRVSWSTTADLVEKYDVTYKPSDASYRVVLEVAGNSDAVILSGLEADTQYQVTVAALWGGHKYRSRPIVFRTLEPPRTSPQQDGGLGTPRSTVSPPEPSPTFPTIRGVEIGIVVLVLIVWIGAIALFFNRWGKIRMLLPYQPDYKQEQLKVPGSSALAAATAGGTCGAHSAPSACSDIGNHSDHMRWSHTHTQSLECEEHLLARCSNRPRVNSAIFVSAEPTGFAGFDPSEFLRRHGSQSQLCRKARSADNIPLTTMSDSSERLCTVKAPREETINEEGCKSDDSGSVETVKHFGLPILSVSGPSPPDEDYDQIDEYL